MHHGDVSRLAALVIAITVTTQAGCGGFSENHRRGLIAIGAAATLTGAIVTADGAYCDDSTSRAGDCNDDHRDLTIGLITLAAGAGLLAAGLLLPHQAE